MWRYHIVGGDSLIDKMMQANGSISTNLRNAEVVFYSGGTDIAPTLYGDAGYHPLTQRSDLERDKKEIAIYDVAMQKRKYQVGICRGAQLLNVLNGGRLWQNVDKHRNTHHPLTYISERNEKFIIPATSDHHQMMIVDPAVSIVWGYAGLSTIKSTFEEDIPQPPHHSNDPEIVWYPRTKSLCFQPHPEWGLVECERLFFDCLKRATAGRYL